MRGIVEIDFISDNYKEPRIHSKAMVNCNQISIKEGGGLKLVEISSA